MKPSLNVARPRLNAAEVTRSWCCRSVSPGLPVRASHTRAVLSDDAVTTRRPSALNAADQTHPWCCRSASPGLPVRASHARAVPSWDPVTTRRPFGLNAAERTPPWCWSCTRGRPPGFSQHQIGEPTSIAHRVTGNAKCPGQVGHRLRYPVPFRQFPCILNRRTAQSSLGYLSLLVGDFPLRFRVRRA